MQMLLQLNHTDKKNGSMGLELAIVEGEYDSLLTWPFRWVEEQLQTAFALWEGNCIY